MSTLALYYFHSLPTTTHIPVSVNPQPLRTSSQKCFTRQRVRSQLSAHLQVTCMVKWSSPAARYSVAHSDETEIGLHNRFSPHATARTTARLTKKVRHCLVSGVCCEAAILEGVAVKLGCGLRQHVAVALVRLVVQTAAQWPIVAACRMGRAAIKEWRTRH